MANKEIEVLENVVNSLINKINELSKTTILLNEQKVPSIIELLKKVIIFFEDQNEKKTINEREKNINIIEAIRTNKIDYDKIGELAEQKIMQFQSLKFEKGK